MAGLERFQTRGFKPLEHGFPSLNPSRGDIVQIDYGYRTGWVLVAEHENTDGTYWITFDDPVSHRAHDEGDIHAYWPRRAEEGVPVSFAYEIQETPYLEELRQGVKGLIGLPLRHFLVGSQNVCLEVISTELPVISTTPPPMDGEKQ